MGLYTESCEFGGKERKNYDYKVQLIFIFLFYICLFPLYLLSPQTPWLDAMNQYERTDFAEWCMKKPADTAGKFSGTAGTRLGDSRNLLSNYDWLLAYRLERMTYSEDRDGCMVENKM